MSGSSTTYVGASVDHGDVCDGVWLCHNQCKCVGGLAGISEICLCECLNCQVDIQISMVIIIDTEIKWVGAFHEHCIAITIIDTTFLVISSINLYANWKKCLI